MPSGDDDDSGLQSGSLSVLLAFGEPVTFTATVSQNSPPASPEPVTHAGWGPWEVNTGYPNPSSFQIISAGKDEAGSRTGHSGSSQLGMGDGSVRLADASDLFVFDGNSQPIGDQNSPPASPEPVTYTGGHFELVLDGHSSSYANPSSFQIVSAGPSPLESDYSGAAPGEDVMCQNNLKIGDDFIIIDYKPTESLKADDNFLVIDWLAEDHFKVDPSDPSVDPTNPNVDLRPMETPGPDDNVGLPAVQTDDGLLLPAVQDDGLLLPAVQTTAEHGSSHGTWVIQNSNAYTSPTVVPGPDDDEVLIAFEYGDPHGVDSRSSHTGGVNVVMGDGSVRQTDTSAVATLMDFDFPSSSGRADYSGSHVLYQDVFIPTLNTGEGFWLV